MNPRKGVAGRSWLVLVKLKIPNKSYEVKVVSLGEQTKVASCVRLSDQRSHSDTQGYAMRIFLK